MSSEVDFSENLMVAEQFRGLKCLDYESIVEAIGEEKYQAICTEARAAAPSTGWQTGSGFNSDLAHDIGTLIWDQGAVLSNTQKLELSFRIYEDMPCYALLMYISQNYNDLDDEAQVIFWDHVRTLLSHEDDAIAIPVAYSLWCDYYEDWRLVEEAWRQTVRPDASDLLIERILDFSGPVPYELKSALYARLVPDKKWHEAIFDSLWHSSVEAYGQIDRRAAVELIEQLDIPEEDKARAYADLGGPH